MRCKLDFSFTEILAMAQGSIIDKNKDTHVHGMGLDVKADQCTLLGLFICSISTDALYILN